MIRNKINKVNYYTSALILYANVVLLHAFPKAAFAQTDLGILIGAVYNVVRPAAIAMGFVMILVAGYKITMSQGDPMRVKIGKEDMTSAIMGLIFVLVSVGILRMIITNLTNG